jgi:hypothetical protein
MAVVQSAEDLLIMNYPVNEAMEAFLQAIKDAPKPEKGWLLTLLSLLTSPVEVGCVPAAEAGPAWARLIVRAVGGDAEAVETLQTRIRAREERKVRRVFPCISDPLLREGARQRIVRERQCKEEGKPVLRDSPDEVTTESGADSRMLLAMLSQRAWDDRDHGVVLEALSGSGEEVRTALLQLLVDRGRERVDASLRYVHDPRVVACFTPVPEAFWVG